MLKKFILFCLVGFGATVIDWSFFNLFYFLGIWFEVAITLSFLVSILFNFTMNRNFTFSARGHSVAKQAYKWIILYLFTLAIRIGIGKWVLVVLGESVLNANIALLAGFAISIPVGFLGSMLWVFKKS